VTLAKGAGPTPYMVRRSRGEPIEIAPGVTGSFQSRGAYSEAAVRQIESALEFALPSAYYAFMATIGESSLFGWSPAGGHWYFYTHSR